ncbi:DUF397 domain-containing protein [Streptomyces sp. B1I3]|uniref:DUF397 domain-containing protein n=1 Tax=Streptomyces sp. B1I3 TaxID=3042264 RepID=UPI002782BAE1|nr:DUF397 domain-containing protein [Streptomyces sp. B1I3]MDQ0794950.1 hypothetical protein [Streptomyces sp. B1I3]
MDDVPAGLMWTRAAPEGAEGPGPWIEIAFGPGDLVLLRETSDPDTVVTTTTQKWDAFTRGVMAGEFDRFAEPDGGQPDRGQGNGGQPDHGQPDHA